MMGIIGAGPAGCFLGSKLAWDKSIIFDKKLAIGNPIQCTGIVTESVYRVLDTIPDDIIINYIDKFRIRSPDGKSIDVKLNKRNIIMDRAGFDKYIAKLAEDAGAQIRLNHELMGWKKREDKLRLFFNNNKTEDVDYMVGADGPFSPVAKKAGIYGNREILGGFQARVKIKNKSQEFEKNVTDILFGLGEFAWVVPETKNTARIGIIGNDTPTQNIKKEYNKLIKPYTILENQSGAIPMYNPKQIMQQNNIALIGDAATQVKATTYGGIIYGLISAMYIGERWDDYEKRFRAKLGKDLWVSLKMRNVLNKFSEKECNDLLRIFEKEENKSFLEEKDRNFPSKFVLQLLMKETKLWKYGFKLFS